ncbi:SGNH/GDSL hydrolase family protein [Microcoleus sp. bin38.metabat.b11b12b14.051]|uniref:SGNH/GDSL hydrolase family protein n=1 Tax=Microcoleus sp. bin38.metabat.b11b12b14.051 TaxID=2742709 RepID=UPI0025DA111B|nr:SGNH/GDSL hydrolase family protein [Microcoleus sp. bin38.metabat.b11b12b14.051]
MKVVLIVLALTSGLWAAIEVLLRVVLGFGNPLIYIADAECGYLLAPNQKVRRLGNRIEINEYSMRTGAIAPSPAPETLRILLLGDSVANGGWWTDQTDTISELMARQLRTELDYLAIDPQFGSKVNYADFEVLNASANSWGPRNQLAYAKRFGVFGAKTVVLLLNTDDLFASAPCAEVVGRDRAYPARQPRSAALELFTRYLLPAVPAGQLVAPGANSGDVVGSNLEAIHQIQRIAVSANVEFLLAVTPKAGELGGEGPRDWEVKARERLAEFVEREKITYIDFLPIFNSAPKLPTLYRDSIHLSPEGNQLVSQTISSEIVAVFLHNKS